MRSPNWGAEYPVTSASYMWEDPRLDLVELGKAAGDPYRIEAMPHLSTLRVAVERGEAVQGKKLLVFLSIEALTDAKGRFITEWGYVREDLLNGLLLFPEVSGHQNEFTFTYLHPGDYYLTVIADLDGDGFPSPGDITHPARRIRVQPRSAETVVIDDLAVKN